jgi:hypothetical protein
MVEPHLIINMLVPTQSVGLLIGKNGSAFRNINQATGININFQSTDDIPDQNFQRVLCLRGENYTSVLAALSMVIEKLQQPRSVPGSSGMGFEEEESCSVKLLSRECRLSSYHVALVVKPTNFEMGYTTRVVWGPNWTRGRRYKENQRYVWGVGESGAYRGIPSELVGKVRPQSLSLLFFI